MSNVWSLSTVWTLSNFWSLSTFSYWKKKHRVSETGTVSVFKGKSRYAPSLAREQGVVVNEWTVLNVIDGWADSRQTGG
jgi:hypothetical protein